MLHFPRSYRKHLRGLRGAREHAEGRMRQFLWASPLHVPPCGALFRSFDHLLGWLGPQVDGLTGREFNLVNTSDPNSERVFVSDRAEYVDPDPGHSFNATAEQIFGGLSELHLAQVRKCCLPCN